MSLLIASVPFPPYAPPGPSFWPIHLAVFVLCAGSLLGLLLRSALPARKKDLLIWLLVAPCGALVFELSDAEVSLGFRLGVGTFVAVTAMTGFVVTALRLYQRQAGPRVLFAVGCLVLFTFLVLSLAPATPTAREASKRTQCKNNLHLLGLGLFNYVEKLKSLPAPISDVTAAPRSWRVELLPWIDGGPLRDRYDDSSAWDAPPNDETARTPQAIYMCPSASIPQDEAGRYFTSYAALTGPNAVFSETVRKGFPDTVADGAANTMMLVEACGRQIVWTEPRDVDISELPLGINIDGEHLGESPGFASSYHTGGFHTTLADGAVKFISENIEPDVLKALTTADSGDSIREF